MTYRQMKEELEAVRYRSRKIRSVINELATLRDDYLAKINNGAIDYSKEHLQKTHDPDRNIIYILDHINREEEKLRNLIEDLKEKNRPYEDMINNLDGLEGEVLRLFYLEAWNMRRVSKHIRFDERTCWNYRKSGIGKLTEKENKNEQ